MPAGKMMLLSIMVDMDGGVIGMVDGDMGG